VSENTRVFAHNRVERLIRFNHWVSRIQLVLDEEHHEFLAEAIVHVDARDPIVVSAVAAGYRSALDGVLVKLERLLTKDKELRQSYKHQSSWDFSTADRNFREEPTFEQVLHNKMTG
jgi:ribosomal subunit interface protein